MKTLHAAGTEPVNKEAEFLNRALPWPDDEAPGVVNMHWKHKGYAGMPGRPFTRLADFIAFLPQTPNRPADIQDIYFCLSLQKEVGALVHGQPKAKRSKYNALALKAIWLDVDVKDDPLKGYKDIYEALDAATEFAAKAGLPSPSAVVASGGGLHVYWISDKALTVEEWRPYAEGLRALAVSHGLRCDASVTIDAARVFRVPGTFNHKTTPARPVRLLRLAAKDIDFEGELAKIRIEGGSNPISQPRRKSCILNPVEFPPLPPITDPDYIAECGVPVSLGDDLDPKPVLEDGGCPFFRDALLTGGKEHDQGLWMMVGLASTFINDGRSFFHKLSNKHPDYNEANVDAMFDRKEAERESNGLGWPSCKAFEQYGSKQCAGCQYKGKIKSPLNLAGPVVLEPPSNQNLEQVKEGKIDPVVALRKMHGLGVDNAAMFAVLNESYAAVKYGGQIMVASIGSNDLSFLKVEEFHKMFANLRVWEGGRFVEVSRLWFKWPKRRQYLDRGVVFEPGGLSDIPDDMLNLFRGFGVKPKQGLVTPAQSHSQRLMLGPGRPV